MSDKNEKLSLLKFLAGDDLDFYETFLVNLSEEEIARFFKWNPEFLEAYHVDKERRELLRDKMYREILRGVYKKQ